MIKHDMQNTLKERLIVLLSSQPWLMQRLEYLHTLDDNAYLAAGVIRNTIWKLLHDQRCEIDGKEIDVVFYDKSENNHEKSNFLKEKLAEKYPENEWDVINQAFVHTWYKTLEGKSIAPLTSLEHALSFWPETATAIAVRINQNDHLEIVAPFGFEDLFQLKLRWNKNLVSHTAFMQRITKKRFLQRFPKLTLIDE
ncbi:nucleotidyltransferase family protein [Acinetobacter gerneri]|uniref:Nucleotidyltransferase family protein n=1 Tax=Acinetobacter gerneri DSM 14967 = CIP 107464 = MTCC 9824 TaxID=1120926 RepID=N8ZVQ9_9GAMM|nr:nucleotidyltransferase family protein [Acinetobacter gerneri]ENV35545.1 hypothetical protein F960_00227 [Acinetobacter gerneri DSM 14967 = CIP 107464 = MTCC 9824]EPR81140.1 hypothetical protein L289_3965 [Acinetobacter gerneri DSM 14967 = CIP 107464 = MTCC 9824]